MGWVVINAVILVALGGMLGLDGVLQMKNGPFRAHAPRRPRGADLLQQTMPDRHITAVVRVVRPERREGEEEPKVIQRCTMMHE